MIIITQLNRFVRFYNGMSGISRINWMTLFLGAFLYHLLVILGGRSAAGESIFLDGGSLHKFFFVFMLNLLAVNIVFNIYSQKDWVRKRVLLPLLKFMVGVFVLCPYCVVIMILGILLIILAFGVYVPLRAYIMGFPAAFLMALFHFVKTSKAGDFNFKEIHQKYFTFSLF